MNTAFANIDANKLATHKQFNGVCSHYTAIISKEHGLGTEDSYILFKRMRGAVGHYFGNVLKSLMTHGDVQKAFASTEVPADIQKLIKIKSNVPEAEAPKKVGRPKKNKAPEPEIKAYIERTAKPVEPLKKVEKNSVAKALEARVNALETKVSDVDNKLDAILAILSKK